jgi:lipoprotein-anchoring transpeptidase ErfK/SrfK
MLAKYTPYVMRSPWPKSSPLWYADSPVSYALLFQVGGYFLHDAPWRSVFGPGSNVVDGTPGGNTTGTHGCVNVPFAAETWLYNWSQIGTTVQILP